MADHDENVAKKADVSRLLLTERRRSSAVVLVALLTAGLLALVPVYLSESCAPASSETEMMCVMGAATLIEREGTSALVALLLPAVIAALAVVWPGRRMRLGVAILLTTFVVLAVMSVGIFFIPAAFAAWVSAQSGRSGTNALS